jgi:hypothetical protein
MTGQSSRLENSHRYPKRLRYALPQIHHNYKRGRAFPAPFTINIVFTHSFLETPLLR